MSSKCKKSQKDLMREILTSKRKVQIRGLYSSAELERKKTDLKKKRTSKRQSLQKSLKVTLPLNSPIIRESSSSEAKKSAVITPVKPTQDDKPSSSKSIVLKNLQTRSAQDEDRSEKASTDTELPASTARENSSEVFRNAFLLEIRKIELNTVTKFERLNKQLQEEKEKSTSLLSANTDLQKENDKINQSMENLKKLIIPMKKKLEEHKIQRDNFTKVERGLREEIGKLKNSNESLVEKVGSFQNQTSAEDTTLLRKELEVQKKKVVDMDVENKKITKEISIKERSLKLVNSQCFALKEEVHKLKKDHSLFAMSKIRKELAEVQKTSNHYKSIFEKYKSDNEASQRTIFAKEQEIKQLKEALDEVKKNQASSSKRKHGDESIFDGKRKRIEEPLVEDSQDSPEGQESGPDVSTESFYSAAESQIKDPDTSAESQIKDTEPAQNTLLAFIDNFAASLSSSSKSQPVTDDLHENEMEDAVNVSLQEKRLQETESSRENPSYSPAKTSHVAKTTSKQIIKIRNVNELLIKSDGGRHETNSSVQKVDFERLEDKEEIKSTMYYKKLLDKDVKGAVEKCLQRFQKTKAILPGEEFLELVNMFVPDFTEKIRSTYLQTHPTENEIAITSADKQYIIDQIILYINLKSSINDYINPMELKIHLQLKLNQKGFAVLKKELVNELFTSLREVNQEAVIAKFARSDQYYTIGHVITNPEKNKISKHWLTKRFVDNALGLMGFNVTTPVVSL